MMYIDVRGGTGYNIACIRVLQALERVQPEEFMVRSPYWDLFAAANIDYYKPEEIRDFILDAASTNSTIIEHRLYDMDGFIKKQLNYKDAWTQLLGMPAILDAEYNKLYLDPYKVFPQLKTEVEKINKELKDKKFILVQFWGGQSPIGFDQNKSYDFEHEPLKRHYPVEKAQKWVDLFREKNPDVEVVQYALPNEPQLNGCKHFTVPYLAYYVLSKQTNCLGAFCIDSSLQHLITGNTKVMVLWGASLPEHFGYSCNKNIIQPCRRDDILYFTELGPSGAKVQYADPEFLVDEFTKYIQEK